MKWCYFISKRALISSEEWQDCKLAGFSIIGGKWIFYWLDKRNGNDYNMLIFIIPCPQAPNNSIWMQSCHTLIYDIVLLYTNDVLWCMMIFRCTGMMVQNQCEEIRLPSHFTLYLIMGQKPHLHLILENKIDFQFDKLNCENDASAHQLCLGKSCPYLNIYA